MDLGEKVIRKYRAPGTRKVLADKSGGGSAGVIRMENRMLQSSVSFAREIRRMETEEVKRLTFPQMLALAVFETRTILSDLRESEVIEVMESMPEGGSKKRAKNRCSPGGIRWGDHGTQTRKGVAEWRGMHGHAAKVRAHRKHVAKVAKREKSYAEISANPIGGFVGNVQ